MTSRHHQRAFQRGGTLLPRGHRPQYPPEGQRPALTHGRDWLVSCVTAGGLAILAWLQSILLRRLTKVWLGEGTQMARLSWAFPVVSTFGSGGVSMDLSCSRRVLGSGGTLQRGQSRQMGWLSFSASSVMAVLFGRRRADGPSGREREKFPVRWVGSYAPIRNMALNVLFPLLFLMLSGGQFVFAGLTINGGTIAMTCTITNSSSSSCINNNCTSLSTSTVNGCANNVTNLNPAPASCLNKVVINGATFILGDVGGQGSGCAIINDEAYGDCKCSDKVPMPPANCKVYLEPHNLAGKVINFKKLSCIPVAAFTMSTAENNASLVASVDASRSNDNGTIVSYEWTTSTGQSATGKTASLVFNQAGTHTITLKITDDEGKTATLQNSLVVNLNSPPQVSFNTSVTEGNIPLVVALDASASTDDGSIASYAWSTSAGQTATGKTTAVTFNDVGTHTIKLTVTDNLGKTASLEKTVVATQQLIRLVAANYPTDLKVGQSFDLTLQFVPDTAKPADGVQVYLEFDPTKLKVNHVTNSGVLDYELFNEIGANYINFAAGSFANPVPLTPFDLVTINLTALQVTGDMGTLLHFDSNQSNVTHLGEFLPQQYEDIRLILGEKAALPKCKVNLQGRVVAPNVSWETELRLYFEGALYMVNTDNSGYCELPEAIPLGDHTLCVKNSHTLANRIGPPLGLGGDGMLDFGTLVEGDVNDDNKINLLDMSELTKLTNGQKDYHKQADLNADGQIDIADPDLLKSNFSKPKLGDTGFCQWDGSTYRRGTRDDRENGTVVLNTSPIPMNLPAGSTFNMDILVQTNTSQTTVDAAAIYLNFDPSALQVNRLVHGSYLDFGLLNEFDNDQGQISYVAGLWNNQSTIGPFTLVTIEFTVLVAGGEQTLSFDTMAPRETDVAFAGESVLNKDTGVTLNFASQVALTITKTGEGTVTGPGVECGNDCTEEYAINTEVKLSATPADGYQFANWLGDCAADTVTMDQAKSCTANFSAIHYTVFGFLKDQKTGNPIADATIQIGDHTTTTDATGYWEMGNWINGDYTATATKEGYTIAPQDFTIADDNVTINFEVDTVDSSVPSITLTKTGDGNGSVQSRPAGIRCGKTCQKDFPENTVVKLIAFAHKGSIFTGWGDDCSGTTKKTTVTVDQALTCSANFDVTKPAPEGMYNLTISVEGEGDGVVTANGINCAGDCQQNHKRGKNLVLKATPDASSTFVGWSGDCEGMKSPLQVKLEQDMTCVATFQGK